MYATRNAFSAFVSLPLRYDTITVGAGAGLIAFLASPLLQPLGDAGERDGVGAGDHLVEAEGVAHGISQVGVPGLREDLRLGVGDSAPPAAVWYSSTRKRPNALIGCSSASRKSKWSNRAGLDIVSAPMVSVSGLTIIFAGTPAGCGEVLARRIDDHGAVGDAPTHESERGRAGAATGSGDSGEYAFSG